MTTRRPLLFTALLLAAPLAACNGLTGIDDLVIKGKGSSEGAGAADPGAGGGPAGSGGSAATGLPPPPPMVEAQGVNITEIALYQGVKRPLEKNGAPSTSKVPIVAGRDALVRVFYTTDGGYDGTPVTANLYLGEGSQPIVVTKGLISASNEATLATTINFDVPGDALVPGLAFRVEIQQPPAVSPGGNTAASYPATGFDAMNVQSTGPSLKVKLVPVAYAADGSNRLPDTSAGQLAAYKNEFFKMYPVQDVELTTRAAVTWNGAVSANGSGWDNLLDAIANLRQQDAAPADVYYFGIFSPASSENQFCGGGGCVLGLGMIGGPTDSWSRAAIGLGFPGPNATETAVHEIGHTHGRQHAPCGGAQGVDPGYPYSNASLGSWGYDLLTKQLIPPNGASDLMGYCWPIWISDYNYTALFTRIKLVNHADIYYPPETLDRTYDRARVDADGNLTWLDAVQIHTPPSAEPVPMTLNAPEGIEAGVAQFYPYDHLPGGVLVWPQTKPTITGISVQIAGKMMSLTR